MSKQLSSWIYSITSGWVTLTAVLVFILFTALVLPGQSSNTTVSEGIGTPDLSIYYSAGELYRMVESYGEQGRNEYIRARFTFDLIWPLVYTFFLAATISWIYQRILPAENPWRMINLLPVLGMIGDYLENISTSIVMYMYPILIPILAWMAGIFTALKWILIAGSFIGLLVGVVLMVWQTIRKGRKA